MNTAAVRKPVKPVGVRRPRLGYTRNRSATTKKFRRDTGLFLKFSRSYHADFHRILPLALDHSIVLLVMDETLGRKREWSDSLPNGLIADLANCDIHGVANAVKGLIDRGVIAEKAPGSGRYKALVEGWKGLDDYQRRKPVRSAAASLADDDEGTVDDEPEEIEPAEQPKKAAVAECLVRRTEFRPSPKPREILHLQRRIEFDSISVQVTASSGAALEVRTKGSGLFLVVADAGGPEVAASQSNDHGRKKSEKVVNDHSKQDSYEERKVPGYLTNSLGSGANGLEKALEDCGILDEAGSKNLITVCQSVAPGCSLDEIEAAVKFKVATAGKNVSRMSGLILSSVPQMFATPAYKTKGIRAFDLPKAPVDERRARIIRGLDMLKAHREKGNGS